MEGELSEKVQNVAEGLMKGLGLEVVDVDLSRQKGRLYVRISIDREGGVTLEDCSVASELIGKVLERDELVPGAYVLEVMSPGLQRPLKKRKDFERSIGKRVKIKLRQPFEGNWSFTGVLTAVGEETLTLDLGYELMELSSSGIARARLDPELPW